MTVSARMLFRLLGVGATALSLLMPVAYAGAQGEPQGNATQSEAFTPDKARTLAHDLYEYGYPLVLMDATMRQATNVPNATTVPMRAPINQFAHFRSYPAADAKDIVRFNFDTLYSFAWVDLRDGPVILSVPDTGGRYYLVPTLDMWTDIFSSLGTRTTGTKAGNYAYVPPGWKGQLPDGVSRIETPTSLIWMMERTQTNGPSDYDHVHAIQDGLKLTPLAQWGKDYTPPSASPTDASIDGKTPPLEQVFKLDGVQFFTRLATLMKTYPPHGNDYPILFRARALGFEPGKDFDTSTLDAATVAAINAGAKDAQADMIKTVKTIGFRVNGWSLLTDNVGTYGTSYRQRAVVALSGLGANLPADAVYPTAFNDSNGKPLDGASRYVLHFAKGNLPPANAFWSITMYDDEGFQVPNPINRFAIGDRDHLKFNLDGSLDIYVQSSSPGSSRQSNWLPSPRSGTFALTLRVYWPRPEMLAGTWQPPAVQRLK